MLITSNLYNTVNFGYGKKPVRVFSNTEGSKRYDSVLDASKEENIEYRNLTQTIKGKTKVYNGKVFSYAEDVEKENGELDIQKALEVVKSRLCGGFYKAPLWKFNVDGSYKEYENTKQISDDTGISQQSIRKSINGSSDIICDSVFLSSNEARTLDEDGKISYDFDEIRKIAQDRFEKREYEKALAQNKLQKQPTIKTEKEKPVKTPKIKPKKENNRDVPIYLIGADITPIKFDSITQASKSVNKPNSSISNLLHFKHINSSDKFFVMAKDIETKDEFGNVSLNTDKINEINQKRQEKCMVKSVYLTDDEGNIEKRCTPNEVDKSKEFHKALNAGIAGISLSDGFLISAKDVETADKNGRIIPEETKIQKLLSEIKVSEEKELRKYSVWALCPDGTYEFYNNTAEAAEANSCSHSNIKMCLSGKSKSAREKHWFWAKDVETINQDGEFVLDVEKCKQILKERGIRYF